MYVPVVSNQWNLRRLLYVCKDIVSGVSVNFKDALIILTYISCHSCTLNVTLYTGFIFDALTLYTYHIYIFNLKYFSSNWHLPKLC